MMLEILLWTITAIVIAAFIVVVSVLCTPVRVSVMFDTQARPAFFVKVALFGGFLPVISTAEKRQKKSAERQKKTVSYKPRTSMHRNVITFAPRMLREMPRLISRVFSCVRLERVDAEIRFGLSDPANTGFVYCTLIPLLQLIGVSERSNIVLHPDFGDEVFDGSGQMGARFVPIALIAPLLSFAWLTMVLPRLSGVLR